MSSLVSKLPFASVDPDPAFLLERKQGLENYLQVLPVLLIHTFYTCTCNLIAMKFYLCAA